MINKPKRTYLYTRLFQKKIVST